MSRKRRHKQNKDYAEQTVTLAMWQKFQRFKEHLPELEKMMFQLRDSWKYHVRYLQEELQIYDKDFHDLEEVTKKIPRILKHITTGHYPPMSMDDEYLDYYTDELINKRHDNSKVLVVKIKIDDISDGNL